jgi:hypothetical protein
VSTTALITAKFDDDLDGTPEEDIGAYLPPQQFQVMGLGRRAEGEQAGESRLTLRLDNKDGRFSPLNGGSPYANFRPGAKLQVQVTWNSVVYDFFFGIIAEIDVRPMRDDQAVFVSVADPMYVLARTEVRPAPMSGISTGLIIMRLLDLSEVGELIANTHFEKDLTGYAQAVGATNTRVTSGDIFEGPAAMETVTAASASSGWTYNLDSPTNDGDHVIARVYVRAKEAADVGKAVRLRGNATGGSGSSDDTAHTLTDTWEPVEVEWIAGTTCSLQVTAGAAVATSFRTGAVHVVLTRAAIRRAVDRGVATIENYAKDRAPALTLIQEVADNELGGFFYVREDGAAVFEQRDHRWFGDHLTSQSTIDETFSSLKYVELLKDRVSEVVYDYPQWVETPPGSQVWSADRLPLSIGPNGEETVDIDFEGGLVRDAIVPVANEDYTINASPDGGGADESANVTLTWRFFGGGAQAVFTNTVARTVFLTSFRLRGTTVRLASDRSPVRATPLAADLPPVHEVLSHNYAIQSSRAHVESWANYGANRWGPQEGRCEITVKAPWPTAATSTRMAAILARRVSDRITVRNDTLPFAAQVDGDFYIDGIDRVIAEGAIEATLRLSPAESGYFRVGVSAIGGTDVLPP